MILSGAGGAAKEWDIRSTQARALGEGHGICSIRGGVQMKDPQSWDNSNRYKVANLTK